MPESTKRNPDTGDVHRWLTGYAVSLVGDQVFFVALAAGTASAASPAEAGFILGAAALPRAVLLVLGGIVVDRWGERLVMLSSDALRVVIMLSAAAYTQASGLGIKLLVVLAATFGVLDAFFLPAAGALPQRLVEPNRLHWVQGLRTGAVRLSTVAGGPLGGVLVAAGGTSAAFLVNAATFVVSFIALAKTRLLAAPPRTGSTSFWKDFRDGWHHVSGLQGARRLLVVSLLSELGFMGAFNVGVPLLSHQRGWGALGLGVMTAAFGVGAATTAILIVARRRLERPGLTLGRVLVLNAFSLAAIGTMPTLVLTAFLALLVGACAGMLGGVTLTLLQAQVGLEYRARLVSLLTLTSFGTIPVAFGGTGVLVATVGIQWTFVVAGAVVILAALVALTSPAVRAAELPSRSHKSIGSG